METEKIYEALTKIMNMSGNKESTEAALCMAFYDLIKKMGKEVATPEGMDAWMVLHSLDCDIDYMLQESGHREPNNVPPHLYRMAFKHMREAIIKAKDMIAAGWIKE